MSGIGCPKCGCTSYSVTCVGYVSPKGHDHDPNRHMCTACKHAWYRVCRACAVDTLNGIRASEDCEIRRVDEIAELQAAIDVRDKMLEAAFEMVPALEQSLLAIDEVERELREEPTSRGLRHMAEALAAELALIRAALGRVKR